MMQFKYINTEGWRTTEISLKLNAQLSTEIRKRTGKMQNLRDIARSLFQVAIDRADPAAAMRMQLKAHPLPSCAGRRLVLSLGKAAIPMMKEAKALLPSIDRALVVTNSENFQPLEGVDVMVGAHPYPEESSFKAGLAVARMLQQCNRDDQAIVLVSGGGSSLMVLPFRGRALYQNDLPASSNASMRKSQTGISLEDYVALNQALLASGLSINDVNLVRQQVDELKGGGVLDIASPATCFGFILSDVIGDDLRVIASGPTATSIGSREDAKKVLISARIWDRLPVSIKTHLSETVTSVNPARPAQNWLIGSNRHSLEAMLAAAPEGYHANIACEHLVGDVELAAGKVLERARTVKGPAILIFGGETTVRLKGNGLGGRNQELTLRFAKMAQNNLEPDWVFMSGGTDGRDGPTDAAGGIVDAYTIDRILKRGGNIDQLLGNNDSYAALKLADDLIITGGTGTNVADVQVFIRN